MSFEKLSVPFCLPDFDLESVIVSDWVDQPAIHLTEPNLIDINIDFLKHNTSDSDILPISFCSFAEYPPIESKKRRKTAIALRTPDSTFADVGSDAVNLWQSPLFERPVQPNSKSWESFYQPAFAQSTCFLTEAGSRALDAVLAERDGPSDAGRSCLIVSMKTYVPCLLAMGIGRSSSLFSFDEDKQAFVQVRSDIRISGCTGPVTASVRDLFMHYGNTCRNLQRFADKVYEQTSPAKIALANATSILLQNLQAHFPLKNSDCCTLVEAEAAFRPIEVLLLTFSELVNISLKAQTDEALLSRIYDLIILHEHQSNATGDVVREVLSHVSRHFLDFAGEWLGVQRERNNMPVQTGSPDRSFVKTENCTKMDEQGFESSAFDFVMKTECMPSFISTNEARILFETGRSLRFIRLYHSTHVLSNAAVLAAVNPPTLQWQFSYQDIEQVKVKALKYEQDLIYAIKQYSSPVNFSNAPSSSGEDESSTFDILGRTEEVETHFMESIKTTQHLPSRTPPSDRLSTLIRVSLGATEPIDPAQLLTLPISLIPELSFYPIIAAQARIVNGITMRLFFKSHHLREHLAIQQRFQLMGDGIFASGLSHALFDPDIETAEQTKGIARSGGTMGLRLGGRENWPPATSELRLALMGILNDSYVSSQASSLSSSTNTTNDKSSLPGDLSFAIREMSQSEAQACMNPHSIYALDFLRLSYKPSPPLEAVLSPTALYKYDLLFKTLLRVLRMTFCIQQLFWDITNRSTQLTSPSIIFTRFRIEAHHFVTCINSHFSESIFATWSDFERKLAQIEHKLDEHEGFPTLAPREGIDGLRIYHERVLDIILSALFLRKRQSAVMKLIEEIFTCILGFARISRLRACGAEDRATEGRVEELYGEFRQKTRAFVIACKSLMVDKKVHVMVDDVDQAGGLFDWAASRGGNSVQVLMERLDLNGYYQT